MPKLQGHQERIRTTIDLPTRLMVKTNKVLKLGVAKSRNALIIKALEEHLKRLENTLIDEEFARMENDSNYCELNLQMAKEFAISDWESLKIGESKG